VSVEYPVMTERLDLNETEDGIVIFDAATDRVHHSNNTAAIVLQCCDGTRTPAQIASLVGAAVRPCGAGDHRDRGLPIPSASGRLGALRARRALCCTIGGRPV